MNAELVLEAIGQLDEDLILDVEQLRKTRKRSVWPRIGALAACLALIVAAVPTALRIFGSKGGPDPLDPAMDTMPLEYNGCYYEVVDIPEVLQRYGLPEEITAELAGEHLAYLELDFEQGFAGMEETVKQTDIELYTYAPAPCRGVLIYREGARYMAAIFCNFRQLDSNAHTEFSELYRAYGVESAADIAALAEVEWNRDKTIGPVITDPEEIAAFFECTTSLPSFGNDDFQKRMFENAADTEEEQQRLHRAFADDLRKLRIETSAGLRFYISVHPS